MARQRAEWLEEQRARAEARNRPAYIRACFNNPDRDKTYWLYTWKPDAPQEKTRIPYTCGSWKCPHCREHAGHVLFTRLQEAWQSYDSAGVVFIVLTLDPKHHSEARADLDGVYQDFAGRQNRWMKALRRWLDWEYGERHNEGRYRGRPIAGTGDFRNRWASVTECHKSGVPHVNIAVYHPRWARDLRKRREAMLSAGAGEFEAIQMAPDLLTRAQHNGFGWRCTAEANRYGNTEAISGYLVKGVKRADAMHGELAKLSQLPTMAPKNFRRLRAGVGFVPPKHKGPCTGTVIRRFRSREGDEHTEPLARPAALRRPADPELLPEYFRKLEYLKEVEHAALIEQRLAWRAEDVPERREDCVSTFRRTVEGSTVSGRMTVINAPAPAPPPKRKPPDERHSYHQLCLRPSWLQQVVPNPNEQRPPH